MNQQNYQSDGPNTEVRIARYYNDAVIGLKIIHEAACESHEAQQALRNLSEFISKMAGLWSSLFL